MSKTRHYISTAFLILFLVLLVYLSFWIIAPFLVPILWAMILARLFHPLHERLARVFGQRRTVSALVLTLGVMALVVMPVSYATVMGVTEAIHLYEVGTEWLRAGGLEQLPNYVGQLPLVGSLSQEMVGKMILAYGVLNDSAEGGGTVTTVAGTVGGFVKNTALVATDFLITLFTLFFLFRDSPSLYRVIYQALPIDEKAKTEIFTCLDQTVMAVVRGTLLTALAQGMVAGITYWLLGVPFPLLLGALSALLALLPMGGSALVWGPIAVYLFWSGAIAKAVVLLVVGTGIVGLMDNVLQPVLVGKGADLPVLLLFFASLGGLAYFGAIGLFLGPIVLGLAKAAFHIFHENYERATRTGPHSMLPDSQ